MESKKEKEHHDPWINVNNVNANFIYHSVYFLTKSTLAALFQLINNIQCLAFGE